MKLIGDLNQKECDYLSTIMSIVTSYEVDIDHLVVRLEKDLFGVDNGDYLQIWYRDEILLYTLNVSRDRPYILLDENYIDVLRAVKTLDCYPGPVYEEPNTRVYFNQPGELYLLSDYLLDALDILH